MAYIVYLQNHNHNHMFVSIFMNNSSKTTDVISKCMGLEALHGELSKHIWFAVTPLCTSTNLAARYIMALFKTMASAADSA